MKTAGTNEKSALFIRRKINRSELCQFVENIFSNLVHIEFIPHI